MHEQARPYSPKLVEGKFSEVALVHAEYPDGRYDQGDAEHELEYRRWDHADQQPADHRPYHRSRAHRGHLCLRSARSRKESSRLYPSTPTATVGSEIKRLAVPAVLMPVPEHEHERGE